MSELIEQVRSSLIEALESDRLTLPTLPEVALNVREAAEDPNVSIPSLCSVIEKDAAVTARIIKVSNSPLFRGSVAIESLQMATTRLGVNYTCNLATGLAMAQMFQATTEIVDTLLRHSWAKSMEIAGIAQVLARHCTKLQEGQASLAGLTHRIGVLPILTYAEDNRKLLSDVGTLNGVIDAVHSDIGSRILKAWDFPKELIDIPLQYMDFQRDAPSADYADLVTAATLQSAAGTDHPLAQIDLSTVKAYDRLGLNDENTDENNTQLVEHIELAVAVFE